MGYNTRDRDLEYWIKARAREVKRLSQEGRALRLIVVGARAFNDRSCVYRVLDRVHRERGIELLRYANLVRATHFADCWAQSRRCAISFVQSWALFRDPAHGLVAFDGPHEIIDRAQKAGVIVWRVRPPKYQWDTPASTGGVNVRLPPSESGPTASGRRRPAR